MEDTSRKQTLSGSHWSHKQNIMSSNNSSDGPRGIGLGYFWISTDERWFHFYKVFSGAGLDHSSHIPLKAGSFRAVGYLISGILVLGVFSPRN